MEDVVKQCAALPGSVKEYPFGPGTAVFKVSGKMFALLSEDAEPLDITIKLPPHEGLALRAEYPGQVGPGYHLDKRHWNTVVLDGVLDRTEVTTLIRQSYDTVVATLPRRLQPT